MSSYEKAKEAHCIALHWSPIPAAGDEGVQASERQGSDVAIVFQQGAVLHHLGMARITFTFFQKSRENFYFRPEELRKLSFFIRRVDKTFTFP